MRKSGGFASALKGKMRPTQKAAATYGWPAGCRRYPPPIWRTPLGGRCGGGGDYGGGDVDGMAVEEAAEAFDGFADG
jgi:hypothetical protein